MSGVVTTALGGGPLDFALSFDPATLTSDLSIVNGDLATDSGLRTAVILSLFCDAPASPDDVLPFANDPNLRGWWGDLPPDGSPPVDHLGSKAWLYSRAPATQQTLMGVQRSFSDCLAWMTQPPAFGGAAVAASVTVACRYETPDRMSVMVTIARQTAGGTVNHVYDLYWSAS